MWSIMAGVAVPEMARGSRRRERRGTGARSLGSEDHELIAYLRTVMRLPVRQIQAYLAPCMDSDQQWRNRRGPASAQSEAGANLAGLKAAIRASRRCKPMRRLARKRPERLHLECEYA